MVQNICGAVHTDIENSNTKNRVQTALDNMVDSLNSFASDVSYASYGPNDHNWATDVNYVDGDPKQYVKNFLSDVADANVQGELDVDHGDVWIVTDAFGDNNWANNPYGYGDSVKKVPVDRNGDSVNDTLLWGGRASSMANTSTADPNNLTRSMIKHEIGHCFGCAHKHGTYYVNNNDMQLITPMATSYVRTTDGYPDTCFDGTGWVPGVDNNNTFCFSRENKKYADYCNGGSCWNTCIHDMDSGNMTFCTKNKIVNNTPLTG